MPKRGRSKIKKSDFKKPFPMRFSDQELRLFKKAADKTPLRDWMRKTLTDAALIQRVADAPKPDLSKASVMISRPGQPPLILDLAQLADRMTPVVPPSS